MKFVRFQLKFKKFLNDYIFKFLRKFILFILYPINNFIDKRNKNKVITEKHLRKASKKTVKYYYKKKYKIYLKRPNAYMTSYFSCNYVSYEENVLSTIFDFVPYKIRDKYKLWALKEEQKYFFDKLLINDFRGIGFEINEMVSENNKTYYQVNPKFK